MWNKREIKRIEEITNTFFDGKYFINEDNKDECYRVLFSIDGKQVIRQNYNIKKREFYSWYMPIEWMERLGRMLMKKIEKGEK